MKLELTISAERYCQPIVVNMGEDEVTIRITNVPEDLTDALNEAHIDRHEALADAAAQRNRAELATERARNLETELRNAHAETDTDKLKRITVYANKYGGNFAARKIDCIKFIREISGLGLKEAKDLADSIDWSVA